MKMANGQQYPDEPIRQALQQADRLRPFLLSNVTPTGKQLGGGSYGVVEELEMDGLVCAGKKIYDSLIDPENQGAQRMVDRYYSECSLLSELRHPHIVQFLGICFLSDTTLPVLVMERLQGSLDELLETTPNIPLPTKLSVLQDVTRGLVFMHNRSPAAVIHRDLTARNILLDAGMTAKIADLGNSRITTIRPDQLAQTMTQGIPGTLVYMPPEVLGSTQRYGPPLDMFSFGHLCLFAAIQVFPKDLRTPNYYDPQTDQLVGRTELQRREVYITTLDRKFGKDHSLVVFIKECLANMPVKRPTARQALERLGVMKAAEQDPYCHMNRLQLENVLTENEVQVEVMASEITASKETMRHLQTQLQQIQIEKVELEEECRAKDKQLAVREVEIEQIPIMRNELEELRAEKSGMEEVCQGKDEVVAVKEQVIAAKQRELSEAEQQVESLTEECANLKGKLEGNTEQILSLQGEIQTLQIKRLEEVAAKDRQITVKEQEIKQVAAAKNQEIVAKQRALSEAEQQVRSLAENCADLKGKLEVNTEQILSLQADIQTLQKRLSEEIAEKEQEIKQMTLAKNQEIAEKELQIESKDSLLSAQESALSENNRGLSSLQQRCGSLQMQLDTVQRRNKSLEAKESASRDILAVKDAHIAALCTELKGKDRILQVKTRVSELPGFLAYSLLLKWKKRIKMSSGVGLAQAVVLGRKLYIGGGQAESSGYKILEHTIEVGLWKEIETQVTGFGVAVVNDQVIITGGRDKEGSLTNQVWVLNSLTKTWTQPFPAMPTAKWWSSAVGYKRWVLVVGGDNEKCVEVLDTKSKQWYTASPLPSSAFRPSLAVIKDTLYVVWEKSAVSVSIPMLLSYAMSQSQASDSTKEPRPTVWQSLPDTPTSYPAITLFHGYLLTVGAQYPPSSNIAMYLPRTKQWLSVAQLPTPRNGCTCIVLPETKEMMVIGGEDKYEQFIKTIDICQY